MCENKKLVRQGGFRQSISLKILRMLCTGLQIGLLALVGSANAQDAAHHYRIPAQALDSGLLRLAADSGMEILFTADKVRGLNANSLDGSMTQAQALSKLLQGSGMTYRFVDANTVTIETPPINLIKTADALENPATQTGGEGQMMPKVTVEADAETDPYDPTDTANPYNKSYAVSNSKTATKTDTPIFDTPVTVQVVSKAVMNDQQAVRAFEAIQNVSGVSISQSADSSYDTFMVRGFNVGNRLYRDGLRMPAQAQSLSGIQQIEVLKGPAAMLYGRLEPGGLINFVSKQPLSTPYYSLQQQFGSFDLYRTTVDATGPIDAKGNFLYRANLEYSDKNSFVDFAGNQLLNIEPSFTWHINDQTQLDFNFRFNRNEDRVLWGIPFKGNRPAPVSISTFIGEPDDKAINNSYYTGVSLSHQFNDDWKVRARFAWNHNNYDGKYTGPLAFDEATNTLSRFYGIEPWEENILLGNVDLTGKLTTGFLEHNLLVGADSYYRKAQEDFFFFSKDSSNTFPNDINITNPVYGSNANLALEDRNAINSPLDHRIDEWYGIYFQDQIKFAKDWHFMFGGRYDWANVSRSFSPGGANAEKMHDDAFSPRIGLLYHPIPELALYGNWVQAFNAENFGVTRTGQSLEPEQSEQYEVGLKGEWFNGKLTTNFAYFNLTRTNIKRALTGGLCGAGIDQCFVLTGEAESEGVEIDIKGQLTPNWDIIATYSNTNALITKGDNQGNNLPGVPDHAGSIWTNYEFGNLGLPGFKLGAGVFLAGQRQGDESNDFQLPGYGRFDLAATYAHDFGKTKATFQLNAINVLDKRYFVSAVNNLQAFPGAPLTLMGSVRLEY